MHRVRMVCWSGVIWSGRCGGITFYDFISAGFKRNPEAVHVKNLG